MADELPVPDTITAGEQPTPPPTPVSEMPPSAAEAAPAAVPEPLIAADRTPPIETAAVTAPAPEEPAPPVPAVVAKGAQEEPEEPKKPDNKHWYVVKVQSGREESIKDAIERRVKIEGLEEYFGQIVIPVEKVTEIRHGKRYVKERKLYPGYLMVQVEYNEDILYLFRETSGVGDFVGGSLNKPPQPMKPHEVEKMLQLGDVGPKQDEKIKLRFDRGDRVKIRDGAFTGMEGEVKEMLETKAHVRVEVTIFGRPVSVELEYWQVEPV
jgi:transcription termination/antitermination protein NusG